MTLLQSLTIACRLPLLVARMVLFNSPRKAAIYGRGGADTVYFYVNFELHLRNNCCLQQGEKDRKYLKKKIVSVGFHLTKISTRESNIYSMRNLESRYVAAR